MRHIHTVRNTTFSIMLCLAMLLSLFQPGLAGKINPTNTLQAQAGVRYGYNVNTGKLSFVGADPSASIQVAGALAFPAGSEQAGLALIAPYARDFGLQNPSEELMLQDAER
jgi:hypothetical protein